MPWEEHALVSTRLGGDKESHLSELGGDPVAEERPKDSSRSQRASGMFPYFTVHSASFRWHTCSVRPLLSLDASHFDDFFSQTRKPLGDNPFNLCEARET